MLFKKTPLLIECRFHKTKSKYKIDYIQKRITMRSMKNEDIFFEGPSKNRSKSIAKRDTSCRNNSRGM